MIVYDLKCAHSHVFEAWFGSAEDFAEQKDRGLVECPICGDSEVERAPSRIAIGGQGGDTPTASPVPMTNDDGAPGGIDPEKAKAVLAKMAEAQKKAVENSDYVGGKFAEEARAMHYGEQDHRPIYGEADLKEAKALHEEGVPATPLLFPVKPRADA